MIQSIRDNLGLSREELALYLRLSPHMVQSVEQERRKLPLASLKAVAALQQAILDTQVHGPVSDPPLAGDRHIRHINRLHRRCRHKLNRCTIKLEEMQKSYTGACFSLAVYQRLAGSQTRTHSKDDLAMQRWTQRQIKDMQQRIEDNNVAMQEILAGEIAALKSRMQVLERSQLFSAR